MKSSELLLGRPWLRIITLMLFGLSAMATITPPSDAAGLGAAMVRLDRVSANTTTGGRVCATPSTANLAATEGSVQVIFPSGFTVDSTPANWTVDTNNLDIDQTPWPGIGSATYVAGQWVTFPGGDLASSSTLYCFNWSSTNTLTTPAAGDNFAGSIRLTTSSYTLIDRSAFAVSIVNNDQIQINASVAPTLTFGLSANAVNLGQLDPSSVAKANFDLTISTNAGSGWNMWVKGQNGSGGRGALHSPSTGHSISYSGPLNPGGASISAGAENYGLQSQSGTSGCVHTRNGYFGVWFFGSVRGPSPNKYEVLLNGEGTESNCSQTYAVAASISSSTPAASDYSDILTFIAAGMF